MKKETSEYADSWEGEKLTEDEMGKALRGICPRCPVGMVIGYKLRDEVDVWKLKCDRCNFVAYHNLG